MRITIKVTNQPILSVFEELSAQSGLVFFFSEDIIPAAGKVTINATNERFDRVLDEITSQTKLTFKQIDNTISVGRSSSKKDASKEIMQRPKVSGKVIDVGDTPLLGVNILVKGTLQGVTSDADGNYAISVPDQNATLVFSFIGYVSQEIAINGRTSIDVILYENVQEIGNVVVTALGITREKKQLGYSVQEVSGEILENATDINIVNSLAGQVSGLKINTASELLVESQIQLRGATPIIVIDGVSTKVSYRELNHNDIENISVLKGSVASALYGSEGRNGVILITTKRGTQNKTSIEVNSTTTWQPGLITYPKTQTTFGSGNGGVYQYVNGTGAGLEGGGFTWGPKLDGRLLPQWNSPIDPATGERIPIPWEDKSGGKGNLIKFLESGYTTVNNINLESGNDKGRFRVSLSHSYQKGIVPNTKLNITGFSIGGEYNLKEWYNINTTLSYSKQYSPNYRTPGYGASDYFYSLAFWLGSDIDLDDAKNYWEEGRVNEQQRFQQLGYYNNPYLIVYENLHTYDKDVMFGQITNKLKIIPNSLEFMARAGVNSNALERTENIPKSTTYITRGNYIVNNSKFFRINTDFILTYKKTFSDFFDVDALFGYSTTYEITEGLTAGTDGLNIPGLFTLDNTMNPVINDSQKNEQRIDGLYGNLILKIWKPFYLSLTARNDRVSTLPVSNNSFLYPSASLAYVLTDMVKMPQWISLMKFRASWSQVNSGWTGSTYGHIPVYSIGSYNSLPTMEMGNTLLPSDLMPSGSRITEFGGEMSLLKNRLGFDVAVYNQTDYDNIISMAVSLASGYGSVRGNGREYERRGTEITLNARPVQGTFTWDLGVNWTKSHRYLTEMEDNKDRDGYIKVGTRTDQLYLIRWLRNQDDQVIYNASTGLPIRDTYRRFVGYSDPDFMFGIQNRFSYKNFSLSISFEGQVGGVYSSILPRMKRAGTSADLDLKLREDAANGLKTYIGEGVVVTGGEVTYDFEGNILTDTRAFAPNITLVSYEDWVKTYYNLGGNEEEGYLDASYLKLRDISLSYTLPSSLVAKLRISSATVSLIGNNVWLLTKKETRGDDPSWFTGTSLKSPTPVNVGINLNLKF